MRFRFRVLPRHKSKVAVVRLQVHRHVVYVYANPRRANRTQTGFALAIGDCGIQRVDASRTRQRQNDLCLCATDLAALIGNAIGQAELDSAEGEFQDKALFSALITFS